MAESHFSKVFTRKISSANVTTAKAEEKMLEDDQYVPPSGHICFLKRKICDGTAGRAVMVSLGGVRMQESRTWKHASELFSRNLSWTSSAFVTEDLYRLKSFQVTTSKARTSTGSVTTPLMGATFVDLLPEESDEFHLIIALGEDVERFCTNNSILEVKGKVSDKLAADVTKWLPEAVVYRQFQVPKNWSDGSQFVQKGEVPISRSGAKIGILSKPDPSTSSFNILCTGGVCKPTPGPVKFLPQDSNIFLLKYPEMIWSKLPSEDLLKRSYHSMYISDNKTVFIVGGYSWEDNKAKKLYPVTDVVKITLTDDLKVQVIQEIQFQDNSISNFPPFLSGFSSVGCGTSVWLFGGISYPEYEKEKENLHCFLPPETPRNKVPDPVSQLVKLDLVEESVTVTHGPKESSTHNGSLQILNLIEPMLIMTSDPHLYIYRPT